MSPITASSLFSVGTSCISSQRRTAAPHSSIPASGNHESAVGEIDRRLTLSAPPRNAAVIRLADGLPSALVIDWAKDIMTPSVWGRWGVGQSCQEGYPFCNCSCSKLDASSPRNPLRDFRHLWMESRL